MKSAKTTYKKLVNVLVLALLLASIALFTKPVCTVQAQLSPTQPSIEIPPGVKPNGTITTMAFLSARPTVVGVNQPVLVNLWITPASAAHRRLLGFKVTITKPNGENIVLNMESERDTGATWFEWVLDQPGIWKFKFDFLGTYLPAGRYYHGYIVTNTSGTLYTGSSYYKPSSSKVWNVTVLEGYTALSWPEMPLPTDYWTRPVSHMHREWLPIIGDFPWYGPVRKELMDDWNKRYPNTSPLWNARQDFFPYVQGPESPHIVWKGQFAVGGITGTGRYAEFGATGLTGYPTYTVPAATISASVPVPPIIFAGRGYMVVTKILPQIINGSIKTVPTSVLQCFDIRNGEVYWETSRIPSGMSNTLRSFGSWIFPGGIEYGGTSASIIYITGGRLIKWHPSTGAVTGNYSISPLTTGTYYRNGYALSVQDLGAAAAPNRYRLINWTTTGTATTFRSRIITNISWPVSSLYATTDFVAGITATIGRGLPSTSGPCARVDMISIDLKTGKVLVNKTIAEELPGYSSACDIADHGLYARLHTFGYYEAYDLRTGNLVWRSEKMDYPWDEPSFGAYDTTSAYGMFYRCGYSGVYAFNWTNGKIVWKYKAPADAPYETPYVDEEGNTVYSFNGVAICADGKLYTINTEHTPTQPITRGWKFHCINAFTGEKIWAIRITGTMGAIADGYITVADGYDGYMYVIGKGKSQTSVSVSQDVVSKGSTVLVKGSVLDMSPAQPGTPCVAKESMATWMEYLHKQLPVNGIWGNETIKGVPVKLCAIKSDGKVVDLGTVTTNGYYGTFSLAWTPEEEGTYTIIASFEGDESYGSSAAATALAVCPPPPEPETPEIPTPTDYMPMLTILAVAVVIAIIIGVVNLYVVFKRK